MDGPHIRGEHSRLRDIPLLRPLYRIPRDDLAGELLVPCLSSASEYDCLSGFFSSSSFRDLAPGLAAYLTRAGAGPMRLVISPYLSDEDIDAMKASTTPLEESLAERLSRAFEEVGTAEDSLAKHAVDCLAWLMHEGRLQVRIAFVRGGLFHPKVWLVGDGSDWVAAHGSSNMTGAGLKRNVEQVSVDTSWGDPWSITKVRELRDEFELLWDGRDPEVTTLPAPAAVTENLLRRRPETAPTVDDYEHAADAERRLTGAAELSAIYRASAEREVFAIPDGLEWENGRFAHQGRAVHAWEDADRRGILAMATGSGKTSTSLIAAERVHAECGRLLIVITAPYLPLVAQWEQEAQGFGLFPYALGSIPDRSKRLQRASEIALRLAIGASPGGVECVILSNDAMIDVELLSALARARCPSLLIADEVHNLGSPGFQRAAPDWFTYRLGLSATPVRQYDEEGTDFLLEYMGPVVFEFGLEEAIGVCLVPYDYYVHETSLSDDELSQWLLLSEKLRRSGWGLSDPGQPPSDQVRMLLIRRRRVLEQAADKVAALEELFDASPPASHTLVYASAKGREQLLAVNRVLLKRGVRFSQLTSDETAQPALARSILDRFGDGSLQVLTAMKVLDEGVNIPQTRTAYLLASSTVEREWVQRRGRVLRIAPGKDTATIHDFLVLPPDDVRDDVGALSIVRGQLTRLQEFSRLARNASSYDSGFLVVARLIRQYLG